MNTIVTWVWHGERAYTLQHANFLAKMLKKRMKSPYRFVVISDQEGEVRDGEVIKTPPAAMALAHLKTLERKNFPTSFRRLWLFSDEAKLLGDVILSTDIDVVVTGDWTPLFDHKPGENFMGWQPGQQWGNTVGRVGGGTWRIRTGSHPEVWERFIQDPEKAMKDARAAGYRGSDQAWMSYNLTGKVPVYPKSAGICSIRDFNRDCRSMIVPEIPSDATVVHFNGAGKPWHPEMQKKHPWMLRYIQD